MDLANIKVSLGIVAAIVAQAFGLIWYVAQLDSTVKTLDTNVTTMQETQSNVDVAVLQNEVNNLKTQITEVPEFDTADLWASIEELEDRLVELETTDALMNNEMRTIMSDHSGFNDVLKELNLGAYGDNRTYGDYK
jgi:formyltetrahydrofolate synthetase